MAVELKRPRLCTNPVELVAVADSAAGVGSKVFTWRGFHLARFYLKSDAIVLCFLTVSRPAQVSLTI